MVVCQLVGRIASNGTEVDRGACMVFGFVFGCAKVSMRR
jgi:hypothetical protein